MTATTPVRPDAALRQLIAHDLDRLAELLRPLFARPAWHDRAACRGTAVADWFPGQGEAVPADHLALCAVCPVARLCAAAGGEASHGWWAGRPARHWRTP